MFFRRKQPETPTVTNTAFRRWLRAQRPPAWFWSLGEDEQEQLALLGDDQVVEEAAVLAMTLRGVAQEQQTEEQATTSLLAQVASQVLRGNAKPAPMPTAPSGFGGHGGSKKPQHHDGRHLEQAATGLAAVLGPPDQEAST